MRDFGRLDNAAAAMSMRHRESVGGHEGETEKEIKRGSEKVMYTRKRV
jgi:hypothetical protein